MLKIKKYGVILEPTLQKFEQKAVLNPAVWKDGEYVHLFYRAVDAQDRSSIGYAKLHGPTTVIERLNKPIIRREFNYEKIGVEDPRITKLDSMFYLTYVVYDGKNALTAYATSKDLKSFKKSGIISPRITYHDAEKYLQHSHLKDSYLFFSSFYQSMGGKNVLIWSKDILFFPKKIQGKFTLIHRILPDIQIVFFDNFKQLQNKGFWKRQLKDLSKNVVLENKHWFESRNIGGGCPPIETPYGWVIIFHTVEETNRGRVYHACAALLDKKKPLKVLARLHEPLFSPTEIWEKYGITSNVEGALSGVVFPTGTALFGSELYIYYGASDQRIAVASVNIDNLIKEMKSKKHRHPYFKE